MKYILLIYQSEKDWANASQAEQEKIFGEHMVFSEALKSAGKLLGGEALELTPTATTVRVQNGKPVHKDGPYAETKEQLGGYYIIDAKDLNEALSWAAKVPEANHGGSVEVRPVMVIPAG